MNDLSGYIIVTGATGGIGGAICRKIVAAGGSVIATCRDSKRGNAFVNELKQLAAAGADVRSERLRLDDIDSIHGFCRRVEGVAHIFLNKQCRCDVPQLFTCRRRVGADYGCQLLRHGVVG